MGGTTQGEQLAGPQLAFNPTTRGNGQVMVGGSVATGGVKQEGQG